MAARTAFAAVLAAGTGSRFGGLKQLGLYRNRPLVRQATQLAESVCGSRSLLVTGHDWQAVFQAASPLEGFLVHNTDYRSGIASSIAAGVRAVHEVASAVLLILADQPLITKAHLQALLAEWNGSNDRIVATTFAQTVGPPAVFPARYFRQLSALQGDRGARSILTDPASNVQTVAFEPAATDVDRPGDLERLPP